MRRTIALFIALMSMAAAAHAQAPATSFGELPSRLSIGETVFVTNRTGKTVKGTVQQVSETTLVLRRSTDDVTLTASDVQRISRRGHTLRNGALTGLAAGFVLGGMLAATADDCAYTCLSSPGGVLAFGGIFGSIGLGVGAVVGAYDRMQPTPPSDRPRRG